MVDYLLDLGVDPDEVDYDKITPFNLLSKNTHAYDKLWRETFEKLLKLEVRIDFPDIKERTAFLNFYEQ